MSVITAHAPSATDRYGRDELAAIFAEPRVVAVDIDGVLYDLVPRLRHWFHTRHGIPLSALGEPDHYDLSRCWPVTGAEVGAALVEGARLGEIFWKGDAFVEGVETLRLLRAAGHRVVLVTARDLPGAEEVCREATESWLASVGAVYDALYLCTEKTSVAFDVLIDDYEANVRDALAAGRVGLLCERSYNAGVLLPQVTWGDVAEAVAPQQHAA